MSAVGEVARDVLAGPNAQRQSDHGLPPLWRMVGELGWIGVGIPESSGGSGGTLADLCEILRCLGGHDVRVPLVEASLAAWLGVRTGELAVPAPMVLNVADDGRVRGNGARLAWARHASHLAVVADSTVYLVAAADARIRPGMNLAEEPRDEVRVEATPMDVWPAPAGLTQRAALLRAAETLGALDRAYALTLDHVRTRRQFGRPLLEFQAVAHGVAELAAERELAATAVDLAVANPSLEHIAALRVVAARAATTVSRLAHQLHGAMGITREYPLHRFTSRLLCWRDEYGSQRSWSALLGARAVGPGAEALWDWLTEDQEDVG